MAPENEQMKRRRRERDRRRRQQMARRRLRNRLLMALIAAVLFGGIIWYAVRQQPDTPVAVSDPVESAPTEPTTVIHIAAAGDVNVTDQVIADGHTDTGFSYSDILMDVAPLLTDADLTVLNFEGNLCGTPYGTGSASAPQQLATALVDAGVDMVQMANSTAIRNGLLGLSETLQNLRTAGLEPLGAYASASDFRAAKGYTIRQVCGIRVGFVAFTKGIGNLGLPSGSESCVNLLYKDYASTYQEVDTARITSILRDLAEESPDIVIAMLHWGSEYNDERSSSQDRIRKLLLNNGVDVIIGTHPHLVQNIAYDESAGTLVAYSLGDFYGDGTEPGSNYSIVLNLEITKDNETGVTKLTGFDYTPIFTLNPSQTLDGRRRVVRIEQALDMYDQSHANRVSEQGYQDLQYALERLEGRLDLKTEEP